MCAAGPILHAKLQARGRSQIRCQVVRGGLEARHVWKKDSASTVLHTNLGNAYLEMWVQQQTRTDIANAIECYERARRPSNDGNQKQKMMATIKLATALSTRCEQQRNTIQLNEAIVFLEDTSKFFKPSDGSKNLRYARSEYELGNAHNVRYKRGNSVEDLNLGILRFRTRSTLILKGTRIAARRSLHYRRRF
ncbi:hypothetical protein NLJ89_g1152 [Agrocybe chaxingu]|uniref:Uncharacterized protein n=1 Tax=Agrocybe chaxingu TaxID=84603 RepID=A0A9W8N0J8_9AGAR|nr:hypothetical protein NLJ89_g1152 [Agrocybe chaxingu]